MTTDDFFTLIASIMALITSIITLAITIGFQRYYDKKHRRVVPAVSFLDKTDNISDRAAIKNARIFTDLYNGLTILSNSNFCMIIKNIEKSKINNCQIKVLIDNKLIIDCNVGTIVEDRPIVIPTVLANDIFYKMECRIDYLTEAEEHFLYKISSDAQYGQRKDEVYLLRKYLGTKHLNILNNQLSISYSLEEITRASQQ